MKIITAVNKLIMDIAPKGYGEKWQINVKDGSVCFGSAFHNWALSIPYMQKKGITFKEVIEAYNSQDDKYKELADKAPLHQVVLNMVIGHLPDPVDAQAYRIPRIWHGDLESEDGRSLIKCDSKGPLYFVITKIVIDPQAGEISAGRLFSGTVTRGMNVYLNRMKQHTKIQQIFIYNGAKREIVDNVLAGNFVGVAGVKAYAGETITLDENGTAFEKITHIFDPVITKAIEAKRPSDLPKLIEVLRMVGKEDPTIKIEINEETGEHLMHGMGELHLEIIVDRLVREFKVQANVGKPEVAYRETIRRKGKAEGKYIKQSGGRGQYGHVVLSVEPSDAGVGLEFVNKIVGGIIPREYIPAVEKGVKERMESGVLAGYPMRDVRVTLYDGSFHEVDSNEMAFKIAGSMAFESACKKSDPALLEPIMKVEVLVPQDFMGDVIGDLNSRRGKVRGMQARGGSQAVDAAVPLSEMFGYSTTLRSKTQGRATYSMEFEKYEVVPKQISEQIIGAQRGE
ncbi:MAG: hypothetical protein IH978_05990 [Nitrospinae bacterium]|nr:hypothetical protein [Nitrospinota bacterium]